ncbi:MAG: M2 family metallopeptidase [Proteobacteria bacterium]|nr:M2 family metallopeptidase [Pseudomonadota bacterium]
MRKSFYRLFLMLIPLSLAICPSLHSVTSNDAGDLAKFIKDYETKVEPLYKNATEASFDARISGKEKDYKHAADLAFKLNNLYTNKDDFKFLEKIKKHNKIKDPDLKRELLIIYNAYKGNQIDPKKLEDMIKLQSEIENKFSTFRANVNGKSLTDNQVEDVLKTSTDSNELKGAWLASKNIGNIVAPDIVKLVKMRNAAAKELGFKNYHEMSLKLSEQDPRDIEKLFDELDRLTRPSFISLKKDINKFLAQKYNTSSSKLMPWHYQNRYFQEAPKIYSLDMDVYYKDKDLVEITGDYYKGIGLPIDDVIDRSDLYEKPGKYQHACCDNIDRKQDIRVTCNIKPNEYWMDTVLHENGHATYEKWLDQSMPWSFREPAHTFTTEAIAMMFGRMAMNPQWLHDVIGVSKEEQNKISDTSFKILRLNQLVFSRWAQVMYRFEKSMYENPEQDLNKLWWKLVEKYQLIKKPAGRHEPDWATKIHIALYPAYYHNYLMGELLASQLNYYIAKNIIKSKDIKNQSYANNKDVGKYLAEKVFAPGRKYYWDDMIKKATGEKLTAKYYAKQFVN